MILSRSQINEPLDTMARLAIFLVVVCFTTCFGIGFHFKDCTNSAHRVITVSHFNLSTDPIHIPGDETIHGLFDILRPIDGHNYHIDMLVQKILGSTYIKIPCFGNAGTTGRAGSCHYDVCSELNEQWTGNICPLTAIGANSNYTCSCPVMPGRYRITAKTYHIPVLHGVLSKAAGGDYKLRAVMTDKRTGEEVGCYEIRVTVATDCTGILCFIG